MTNPNVRYITKFKKIITVVPKIIHPAWLRACNVTKTELLRSNFLVKCFPYYDLWLTRTKHINKNLAIYVYRSHFKLVLPKLLNKKLDIT